MIIIKIKTIFIINYFYDYLKIYYNDFNFLKNTYMFQLTSCILYVYIITKTESAVLN